MSMETNLLCWTHTTPRAQSSHFGEYPLLCVCACVCGSVCQAMVLSVLQLTRTPCGRQLRDNIRTFGAGLQAVGLQPGDKVRTAYSAIALHYGCMHDVHCSLSQSSATMCASVRRHPACRYLCLRRILGAGPSQTRASC